MCRRGCRNFYWSERVTCVSHDGSFDEDELALSLALSLQVGASRSASLPVPSGSTGSGGQHWQSSYCGSADGIVLSVIGGRFGFKTVTGATSGTRSSFSKLF